MIGTLLRFLFGHWAAIAFGLAALCALVMAVGVCCRRFRKVTPIAAVGSMCLSAWGWYALPRPTLLSRPSALATRPQKVPKVEMAAILPPKVDLPKLDLPKVDLPNPALLALRHLLPDWGRIGRDARAALAQLGNALPNFSGLDFYSAAARKQEQELNRKRKQEELRQYALARKQHLRLKQAHQFAAIDSQIAQGIAQARADYERGLEAQYAQARAAMTPRQVVVPGAIVRTPTSGPTRSSGRLNYPR